MQSLQRTALILTAMVGLLSACKPAPTNEEKASKPTETAPQVASKPAPKKVAVSEVDFSKMPGASKPAAFGYYYGVTSDQVTNAGIELQGDSATPDDVAAMNTKEAPLPWSDVDHYSLFFIRDKLWKIKAFGNDITADSDGSKGKAAFANLLASLKEKYGKPKDSYTKVGVKLYKERDEFYQCLAYEGCGLWVAVWKADGKDIVLQLRGGRGRGNGWIEITYEASPEWGNALDEISKIQAEKDRKGL